MWVVGGKDNAMGQRLTERDIVRLDYQKLVMEGKVNKKTGVEHDKYDVVGAIVDYESGMLDTDATIELFQHLVDTGMAWQLQGSYGRTADSLVSAGIISQ